MKLQTLRRGCNLKHIVMTLLFLLVAGAMVQPAQAWGRKKKKDLVVDTKKQEFRGVWIQTAFQDRFMKKSPAECRQFLESMVDDFYKAGFNAIIFQVRPEGDAFYKSSLEPWSRFLTGKQGIAPIPEWDPMACMIQLCHDRHMEFHAWLNPYRMSATKSLVMSPGHLYYQHPEWFVRHQDKLYLNPGLPESRSYIREVVKDIVTRYEVDAIHMDDYFYPYPSGEPFNDTEAYHTYAPVMGFDVQNSDNLGAWRRRNVNILIKSLCNDIKSIKPWVRFGISPFGIYRNAKSWKDGSQTNGTQCFDNLYADILLWCNEGWIDYVIPQIYWEIGHKLADYNTLVKWWDEHVPETCHLYIGQSIERSLDGSMNAKPTPDLRSNHEHFTNKLNLARECKHVRGNCFWYGFQVYDNQYHVRDYLSRGIFASPAMLPAFTSLDAFAPDAVKGLDAKFTGKGVKVSWVRNDNAQPKQHECYYMVYRFKKGERVKTNDLSHLLIKTDLTEFYDYDVAGSKKFTYVVTAIDPYNNESKPTKTTIKVKLK